MPVPDTYSRFGTRDRDNYPLYSRSTSVSRTPYISGSSYTSKLSTLPPRSDRNKYESSTYTNGSSIPSSRFQSTYGTTPSTRTTSYSPSTYTSARSSISPVRSTLASRNRSTYGDTTTPNISDRIRSLELDKDRYNTSSSTYGSLSRERNGSYRDRENSTGSVVTNIPIQYYSSRLSSSDFDEPSTTMNIRGRSIASTSGQQAVGGRTSSRLSSIEVNKTSDSSSTLKNLKNNSNNIDNDLCDGNTSKSSSGNSVLDKVVKNGFKTDDDDSSIIKDTLSSCVNGKSKSRTSSVYNNNDSNSDSDGIEVGPLPKVTDTIKKLSVDKNGNFDKFLPACSESNTIKMVKGTPNSSAGDSSSFHNSGLAAASTSTNTNCNKASSTRPLIINNNKLGRSSMTPLPPRTLPVSKEKSPSPPATSGSNTTNTNNNSSKVIIHKFKIEDSNEHDNNEFDNSSSTSTSVKITLQKPAVKAKSKSKSPEVVTVVLPKINKNTQKSLAEMAEASSKASAATPAPADQGKLSNDEKSGKSIYNGDCNYADANLPMIKNLEIENKTSLDDSYSMTITPSNSTDKEQSPITIKQTSPPPSTSTASSVKDKEKSPSPVNVEINQNLIKRRSISSPPIEVREEKVINKGPTPPPLPKYTNTSSATLQQQNGDDLSINLKDKSQDIDMGPHASKFDDTKISIGRFADIGGGISPGSSGSSGNFSRSSDSSSENDSDGYISPRIGGKRGSSNESSSGLTGLRNIGNTCFMNSVLQCLSNTAPLLKYFQTQDYLGEINYDHSAMKGALVKAFANVLQDLWKDSRVVDTSNFKDKIQQYAPRFMGYSQQDAQEFLRYLLEGLHEEVNRTTNPKRVPIDIDEALSDNQKASEAWKHYLRYDNSVIVDLFVGQLKSTLKCTVCGHCSVTFDPFWDLSLPIPSRSSQIRLTQCLDLFTKEEVLDGDEKPTCSKCQKRQKCTKSFLIQKFPKILVIHLKRFSPNERYRGKLSTVIDFPLSGLDLGPYTTNPNQGVSYNLYGISNHSGSAYSGHYIASCKHPISGEWHCYNDSRVSAISKNSIVSSEAYVLFYEFSWPKIAPIKTFFVP